MSKHLLLLVTMLLHLIYASVLAQSAPPATNTANALFKCTYQLRYQPDSLNRMSAVSERAFLFIAGRTSEYATEKGLQMNSAKKVLLARAQLNRGSIISLVIPVTKWFAKIKRV